MYRVWRMKSISVEERAFVGQRVLKVAVQGLHNESRSRVES